MPKLDERDRRAIAHIVVALVLFFVGLIFAAAVLGLAVRLFWLIAWG